MVYVVNFYNTPRPLFLYWKTSPENRAKCQGSGLSVSPTESLPLPAAMCDIETKILRHLKEKSVPVEEKCWDVRKSSLGGRGLFANRNISPGEVIFVDSPIVIGPRARNDIEEVCVKCFKIGNLNFCENKCGLKVCSEKCQTSKEHRVECEFINSRKNGVDLETSDVISKCLAALRALFLDDESKKFFFLLQSHKHPKHEILVHMMKQNLNFFVTEEEETFLKLVCSVLDANSFEVLVSSNQKQSTLRGLYPLGSLANHECSPNAVHFFDDQQRMITRAAVFIPKDTEICHSYTRLTWGTITRRYHLFHTKHFACKCPRCQDPTEFGTNLSAIKCQNCQDIVLPENPLLLKSKWKCIGCKETTPTDRISFITSVLGSNVRMFEDSEDVNLILKFLNKVSQLVPESNQIFIELKYRLVWILGYRPGCRLEDLTENLLDYKETSCREILELLGKLKTGICKMRGLLLYELYQCGKEKIRRGLMNNQGEIDKYLEEAAYILMYDVGAPAEVRKS